MTNSPFSLNQLVASLVQSSPLPIMLEQRWLDRMKVVLISSEEQRQEWLENYNGLSDEEAASWTVLGG